MSESNEAWLTRQKGMAAFTFLAGRKAVAGRFWTPRRTSRDPYGNNLNVRIHLPDVVTTRSKFNIPLDKSPRIHMESQGTLNNQNTPEREK